MFNLARMEIIEKMGIFVESIEGMEGFRASSLYILEGIFLFFSSQGEVLLNI